MLDTGWPRWTYIATRPYVCSVCSCVVLTRLPVCVRRLCKRSGRGVPVVGACECCARIVRCRECVCAGRHIRQEHQDVSGEHARTHGRLTCADRTTVRRQATTHTGDRHRRRHARMASAGVSGRARIHHQSTVRTHGCASEENVRARRSPHIHDHIAARCDHPSAIGCQQLSV